MPRRLVQLSLLLGGVALLAQGLYIPAKAELAKHLIAKAWAASLETGAPVLPWAHMDAYPVAQLTLSDDESHIVLNTDSGQALAFGPALVKGTSLTDRKMIAIAAHKNTQFSSLKDLRTGHTVSLQTPKGITHHYRISGNAIIDTRREAFIRQNTESLALITCYPFDAVSFNGPMRYVVYADKIKAPLLSNASNRGPAS